MDGMTGETFFLVDPGGILLVLSGPDAKKKFYAFLKAWPR